MVDNFGRALDGAYLVVASKGAVIARLIGWTSKGRGIFQTESGGRVLENSPGECQEYCGSFVQGFYSGKWKFKPGSYN